MVPVLQTALPGVGKAGGELKVGTVCEFECWVDPGSLKLS